MKAEYPERRKASSSFAVNRELLSPMTCGNGGGGTNPTGKGGPEGRTAFLAFGAAAFLAFGAAAFLDLGAADFLAWGVAVFLDLGVAVFLDLGAAAFLAAFLSVPWA